MLVPDPKVVRKLLTRYAELRISQAQRQHPQAAAELNDVVYTLCVMTGTTDIREAIVKADALLAAARSTPKTVIVDGRAAA
ncbi:DUF5133 domain-containing protein [Streptomyces sp. NPDC096013]|uniref:DUF5133 domain-containing protein n=1 Tax=Streptomyces sp. NPDC096013 TaxID=3366069 RepID=UPI003830C6DD